MPVAQASHVACASSDHSQLIAAHAAFLYVQALWLHNDGRTVTWIPLRTTGSPPCPRHHHSADLFKGGQRLQRAELPPCVGHGVTCNERKVTQTSHAVITNKPQVHYLPLARCLELSLLRFSFPRHWLGWIQDCCPLQMLPGEGFGGAPALSACWMLCLPRSGLLSPAPVICRYCIDLCHV